MSCTIIFSMLTFWLYSKWLKMNRRLSILSCTSTWKEVGSYLWQCGYAFWSDTFTWNIFLTFEITAVAQFYFTVGLSPFLETALYRIPCLYTARIQNASSLGAVFSIDSKEAASKCSQVLYSVPVWLGVQLKTTAWWFYLKYQVVIQG